MNYMVAFKEYYYLLEYVEDKRVVISSKSFGAYNFNRMELPSDPAKLEELASVLLALASDLRLKKEQTWMSQ